MFECRASHSDGYELIKIDRLAFDRDQTCRLMMISFVAPSSIAKTVIAAVRSKKASTYFRFRAIEMLLHENGYSIVTTKLPKFDRVHVIMLVRNVNLLFGDIDDQLGKFLLSKKTTTPMLPQWVPIVTKTIREKSGVSMIDSVGIDAYKVEVDDTHIDEIVSVLLQSRKIRINVSKQSDAVPC